MTFTTANAYWAHSASEDSSQPGSRELPQLLSEHLAQVSRLAGYLANLARPQDHEFAENARLAGLFHDYGKYTDAFQRRIRGGHNKCPHAIHGSVVTAGDIASPLRPVVSLAIAGHHAGIPDYRGKETALTQKLQKPDYRQQTEHLSAVASSDSKDVREALQWIAGKPSPQRIRPDECDLYTRMLFSCLVDADRLDSARRSPRQDDLRASERLQTLLSHLERKQAEHPPSRVNALRRQILEDCLAAASQTESLFSLTVPTGGGKTLSAMAFALQRAVLFPGRFRRIIVVIPYLSIIEQNARVYAELFGSEAILEHHSGSIMPLIVQDGQYNPAEDKDDEDTQDNKFRIETENWDAPIVVTTSTRFFESLFSNRPKDLRRAHNIARSIVILDEVQTLPRRLLSPLLAMQKELATDWGANFVFSTATQPAFEERNSRASGLLWPRGTVTEIIRQPEELRRALVRARIQWNLDATMSWEQIAERMMASDQALAIVNLRDHASELYSKLLLLTGDAQESQGCFHLSTRMCAAHRLRVIDSIRERLAAHLPCRVVSTQLIEAGVDLDFPLVLRTMAPLEAIVQAAGRADREGHLTAARGEPAGRVIVFRPEDERMPPHEYTEAAGIALALARQRDVQVDDGAALREYYERYYEPDPKTLGADYNAMRLRLEFASLAEKFEYINSRTRDVFVPDDAEARAAIEELKRIGQLTYALRRRLQRHTVGLNPSEFEKAHGMGAIYPVRPESDFWIATEQAYSQNLGLQLQLRPDAFVI